MRLQHQFRRGPGEGITVGSTRYLLDEQGFVEVTEEHAGYMLAGKGTQWAPSWPDAAPTMPQEPVAPGAGRRPRTREELNAALAAEGIGELQIGFDSLRLDEPEGPARAPEAPEEVLEISTTTPFPELRRIAATLGIAVKKGTSRDQLLELLQAKATEGV